jgi:SAM-dependent methyltransferase
MALPLPPPEMRALVGPREEAAFDNPSGDPLFEDLPAQRIFDFGCGCGRVARQLIQQREQPERYVGVDLHPGMVAWARENLAPAAPQFAFHHIDVHNPLLNPEGRPEPQPFPAPDAAFSLALAHSVFTHVLEPHVPFYLRELSRVLEPGGILHATWFTFERSEFPMRRDDQHALYMDLEDPTYATVFDRDWIREQAAAAGLTIVKVVPPQLRGYHWYVDMQKHPAGAEVTQWPPDSDWVGRMHHPERERWRGVPATEAEVRWLYRYALRREPAADEVAHHAGAPLRDVLAAFMASDEAARLADR